MTNEEIKAATDAEIGATLATMAHTMRLAHIRGRDPDLLAEAGWRLLCRGVAAERVEPDGSPPPGQQRSPKPSFAAREATPEQEAAMQLLARCVSFMKGAPWSPADLALFVQGETKEALLARLGREAKHADRKGIIAIIEAAGLELDEELPTLDLVRNAIGQLERACESAESEIARLAGLAVSMHVAAGQRSPEPAPVPTCGHSAQSYELVCTECQQQRAPEPPPCRMSFVYAEEMHACTLPLDHEGQHEEHGAPDGPARLTRIAWSKQCGKLAPPGGIYVCCEAEGHEGDHVARGAPGKVYARWAQSLDPFAQVQRAPEPPPPPCAHRPINHAVFQLSFEAGDGLLIWCSACGAVRVDDLKTRTHAMGDIYPQYRDGRWCPAKPRRA